VLNTRDASALIAFLVIPIFTILTIYYISRFLREKIPAMYAVLSGRR